MPFKAHCHALQGTLPCPSNSADVNQTFPSAIYQHIIRGTSFAAHHSRHIIRGTSFAAHHSRHIIRGISFMMCPPVECFEIRM
jgi:hypothetical protein